MKLVEMKCKNCGSILTVEDNQTDIKCDYCQAHYKLDDEVQHIKYDDMEKSGYEFEKGRLRAQKEHMYQNVGNINVNTSKKRKKTSWLILAWIFLFPFTLTYYIIKSNKLDTKKKIIILVIAWTIFLIIAYANPTDNSSNVKEINNAENVK